MYARFLQPWSANRSVVLTTLYFKAFMPYTYVQRVLLHEIIYIYIYIYILDATVEHT